MHGALAALRVPRLTLSPATVLPGAGVHAHDPWGELPDRLHQIDLGGHHGARVLVCLGRLVEGATEKCDPLLPEVLPPGSLVELLERPRPAHAPARPMGSAVQRVLGAEAEGNVTGVGHRPWHDPEHACSRGGGALAVDHHLLPAPLLGEGEVVVVLGDKGSLSPDPTS